MTNQKNLLFESLVNKKLTNFIENQLNGRWNFLDFYEAYCLTICALNIEDKQITKKLDIANYFKYGIVVDVLNITEREPHLSDNQFRLLIKNNVNENKIDLLSELKLKEKLIQDNSIISNFLLEFNEEEIEPEVAEGIAGKFVIGVLESQLQY